MKLQKVAGSTSQILQIFIADSSSTTGAGLTGLAFNTGSLTAYYHRKGDTTATAITLVTMTVGTFTSSGFAQIDATNMPGWYQLCPPDACFATGDCAIHLKGAANMAPLPIEIQITAAGFDPDAAVTLANATQISGDSGAADNLEAMYDGTGYAPAVPNGSPLYGITAAGTLSGTHSSTTADLGTNAPSNDISGQTLYFPSHKVGRLVDSYNTGTGVATFSPAVAVTLANSEAWVLYASPPASTGSLPGVNVAQISGDSGAADNAEAFFDGTGYAGTNNVIPTVTAVTTVNGLAANSLTAAAAAADLGTELATAVWAAVTRTLSANTNLNDLSASAVRAALGMASANLDTQIAALPTAAENAAELLSEAQSTPIEANVKAVNDVTLGGDGTSGTPWGPA